MTETIHIPVDLIDIPKDYNPIKPKALEMMIDSFETGGQLQPIQVFRKAAGDKRFILNFGLHRLTAARKLGWPEIDATETTGDAEARRLAQIDENLVKQDMTELERANLLKERKQIFDAKAGQTGGGKSPAKLTDGRKAGPQHAKGFDQSTADATGMDKSTIRKLRQRAEKLPADVQDSIKGTEIADSGVELDALAAVTPAKQRKAVETVKAGKARTVRLALKPKKRVVPEAALVKLWEKQTPAARKAFVAWVRETAPKLLEIPAPATKQ